MIAVIETKTGFERISGNPTLDSLDGQVRAPLAVVLHDSWTAEERAKFGIFMVEPMAIPEGKERAGASTFQRQRDGSVVEVVPMKDKPLPREPEPTPLDDLRTDFEALAKRVAALEGAR